MQRNSQEKVLLIFLFSKISYTTLYNPKPFLSVMFLFMFLARPSPTKRFILSQIMIIDISINSNESNFQLMFYFQLLSRENQFLYG